MLRTKMMREGHQEYQALYEARAQIQDNQKCFEHADIYTTPTKIHNWQLNHRGVSKQFNSRHHLLHTVLLIPTQISKVSRQRLPSTHHTYILEGHRRQLKVIASVSHWSGRENGTHTCFIYLIKGGKFSSGGSNLGRLCGMQEANTTPKY